MMPRGSRPVPAFPSSAFKGFRFPPEIIVLAVRWYLRFGLSYRDVEELLTERGIEVDHVTVFRWVQRFTPLRADAVGTVRHELCDRTLIWNHRHLEQLLREYVEHYNAHRPHRSLGQRAPNDAEVIEYRPGRPIRRHQTCNGLINQYHHAA